MLRNIGDAFYRTFEGPKNGQVQIDDDSINKEASVQKVGTDEMTEKIKAQGNTGSAGTMSDKAQKDTENRSDRFDTKQPVQ
ncbi:hypothetical protein PHYBLDRAFT_158756 [Phycomyces blakesleeanus NRRL 1555(-)]|uniref:Uncharacterized protein n=1 Tax=Phycomyces blakesleeanus (strain ATCC 8743b / DSM 1359 / FGSC 10004 / NBRC 33097 / NRRL 1555) TaxID=763407 RepID=A0A167MR58_PHYB8|nr:hypothetical protein PHYBLDRAFT_158756 [Phycomyces blakesleeanus NRRL 1555(-)]OAD73639.1 hypothetical protein PHYBLDRAFT_158756 [Phycomyces blakesleeanus NRRL 1555(-)]|eukprot:XP_018291679.1 hypothetical protein PHYBLDRAFT_158756 [Phycomyces blakesleeanus NRRL 1555(-)]